MSATNKYRKLVQLVERRSPKPDVVSSNLTFPARPYTVFKRFSIYYEAYKGFFFYSRRKTKILYHYL